jgi:hypothetical protein
MAKFGNVMRKRVLMALQDGMTDKEASDQYKVPVAQIERWRSAGNKMFSFGPKQIAIQQQMRKPRPAENLFDPEIARARREEEERKTITGRILEDLTTTPEDYLSGPEVGPSALPPKEVVSVTALTAAERRAKQRQEAAARYAQKKRAEREARDPAYAARQEAKRAGLKPSKPKSPTPVPTARDQMPYLFDPNTSDAPAYVPLPLLTPLPETSFTSLVAGAQRRAPAAERPAPGRLQRIEPRPAYFPIAVHPDAFASRPSRGTEQPVSEAGAILNGRYAGKYAAQQTGYGTRAASGVGWLPKGSMSTRIAQRKQDRLSSWR